MEFYDFFFFIFQENEKNCKHGIKQREFTAVDQEVIFFHSKGAISYFCVGIPYFEEIFFLFAVLLFELQHENYWSKSINFLSSSQCFAELVISQNIL